jgi:SAM-dependent methyltransferase
MRLKEMNQEYSESTYGDRIAEIYDQLHPSASAEAIAALRELAGAGPVLELGIGTGRLALPLAGQGIEVHGIDSSAAMVAKLTNKQGGDRIPVTIGNFAEIGVNGDFSLIFVAFNTFFGLISQEEQVKCFANVANRLRPGGLFLIEAFVPDLNRYRDDQVVKVNRLGVNEVILEASRHDRLTQRVMTQHIVINQSGVNIYPVQVRYAWPAELDLMARMAGMRLHERWGNWRRDPFVAASTNHISIYELP